jgi:hypothetical protein
MRPLKPRIVGIAAAAMVTVGAAAGPATAGNGSTDYTHPTTLKEATCRIHANIPKPGVPDWGWTKTRRSPHGGLQHVGVRYTYKGYALVLDYSKKGEPSWAFIAQSCLTDRHAYDGHGHQLPDLRAVGGNAKVKDVLISAPHAGKTKKTLLHVGAGQVGTLRNARKSFAVGNVRAGDPFWITTVHCGKHSTKAWILGYAPNSGRWGYVQAAHLPTCH